MSELFIDEMGREWEHVLFVMLSEPNGTSLGKQFIDYSRFFWRLATRTNVPIMWRTGIECGHNAHGHFIVSVPRTHAEYFKRRRSRFKAGKEWKFRTLSFDDWETGHNTEWYVCVKHTDLGLRITCPHTSKPCRDNRCPYEKEK